MFEALLARKTKSGYYDMLSQSLPGHLQFSSISIAKKNLYDSWDSSKILAVPNLGKIKDDDMLRSSGTSQVGAADPLIVTFEAATYDPLPFSMPFPAARSAAGKLQGEHLRVPWR